MVAPDVDQMSTRRRLEMTALGLFDDDGYDNVTTQDIADAAGVTQRTFFRHFPTKLDALMGDTGERTMVFVNHLFQQPPTMTLREALIHCISEGDTPSGPDAADVVRARVMAATPSLHAEIRRYDADLEAHFVEWIAQRTRRPRDDFDVKVAAAVIVAARRATVEAWRNHNGSVSITDLAHQALDRVDIDLDSG